MGRDKFEAPNRCLYGVPGGKDPVEDEDDPVERKADGSSWAI